MWHVTLLTVALALLADGQFVPQNSVSHLFRRPHYIFDAEPAITFAASYGNTSEVRRLLESGADPNARDWLMQTPLHLAAKFNRLEVVKLLVEHGAQVNARNRDYEETPLHLAAKGNHLEMMNYLIDHGAVVDSPISRNVGPGGTPLLYSILYANSPDAVDLLIARGADVNATNSYPQSSLHLAVEHQNIYLAYRLVMKYDVDQEIKDEWGNTALNWLVKLYKAPQVALARLLIVSGSDIETLDNDGRSPLHNAAMLGHVEFALLLLEKGANVDQRDYKHHTPLYSLMAQGSGRTGKMARLLLNYGADPNTAGREGCDLPLHVLIANPSRRNPYEVLELTRQLLLFGANYTTIDPCSEMSAVTLAIKMLNWRVLQLLQRFQAASQMVTDRISTVDNILLRKIIPDMIMAAAIGHLEAVQIAIVRFKADVNLRDYRNQTALHLAAENGNYDVVDFLIQHHADISAVDVMQRTPLHYAAAGGNAKVMKLLIDNGADPNAVASNGAAPIHYAIDFRNSSDGLRVLIENGGNVSQPLIPDLMEPIHFAAVSQNFQYIEYLLSKGANINARNANGATALNHLLMSNCCYPQLPVIGYFLDHGADLEARNKDGLTPLHMAILSKKKYEVIEYLLYRGADPNAHDNNGCNAPLYLLSKSANHDEDLSDIAALLIQFGADYQRVDDCTRFTILEVASDRGQTDIVGLINSLP